MRVGGQASGVAIDSEGNFFFSDAANRRVRVVRFGAFAAPANATISALATGSAIRATVRNGDGAPVSNIRVDFSAPAIVPSCTLSSARSEERRVGKECKSGWAPGQQKKEREW